MYGSSKFSFVPGFLKKPFGAELAAGILVLLVLALVMVYSAAARGLVNSAIAKLGSVLPGAAS